MTRFIAVVASIAALAFVAARPAHAADISGVWLIDTGDAHIKMAKCGANMCGTIIWIKDPVDPKTGKPQTDEKNPDPNKRSRPLVGVQIAFGFHTTGDNHDKYVGEFYNAEDGKNYRGSIVRSSANELTVEGCLLVFCQTKKWTHVSD
jgi:uncharacterized protein (DUF2147 family)